MRVLIVEDEFIIAHSIQSTLVKYGHKTCPICASYTEAKDLLLTQEHPDVIIIDLKLEGNKSGIDLAELINQTFHIPFIFLTSSTDRHLLDSLKYLNPSGIIIKPFNAHELNATLSLINFQHNTKTSNIAQKKDSIFIKQKSELIKILYSDILYLKSNDVYVTIKTIKNQSYQTRATLDTFIKKLNHDFTRVHRSFIVNTNYIDKVYKEHLLIESNVIPIGKTYKSEVLNILNIL